jgi:hypothetical protein
VDVGSIGRTTYKLLSCDCVRVASQDPEEELAASNFLTVVMTAWQFGYAGNHIILRTALNMGVSKLVFPLYRNIVALLLLAPSAYFLE